VMDDAVKCAEWARDRSVQAIGTAGCYDGFLLVEWPTAWPRDASDVEELQVLAPRLADEKIRLQLIRSADSSVSTMLQVILYRAAPGGWFERYLRTALSVSRREVAWAAARLLAGDPGEGAGEEHTTDVLICTHGTRDMCCGSLGTRLAAELVNDPIFEDGRTRLWRTSHTGGHRFAPTALVLPSGTLWGFLDPGSLRRIVSREGDVCDALPHYRGCTGLGSREAQLLDRAAFESTGWGWLDHRRRADHPVGGRVALEALAPDGTACRWDGVVIDGRELPVPVCRSPLSEALKSEVELVLGAHRRLP
jgi:hypothetical protein